MSEQSIRTFVAGDVVTVAIELLHSMNVTDAKALFVNETHPREIRGRFEMRLAHELEDADMASLLTFKLKVDAQHLHGEYRLERLIVRSGAGYQLEVLPPPDIRFRIEPENTEVLRVRRWGFED